MRKRESKITVVVIGVILVVYILFAFLGSTKDFGLVGLPLGYIIAFIIGGGIILTIIYTVYDRLKEMKGEDEDDFSKY